MSKCPSESSLLRFVSGELEPSRFQSFDSHIDSCRLCQNLLEHLTHNRVVANDQEVESDTTLLDALALRIHQAAPEPARSRIPQATLPIALEDHQIVREIGRGGMGIVYEARQLSLNRRVAIKVIPHLLADTSVSIRRFELEAITAARLQHEHIVPVYDVGSAANLNWYSMRLIDGEGLDQMIKSARSAVEAGAANRRELLSCLAESKLGGASNSAFGNRSAAESSGRLVTNNRRFGYFQCIAKIVMQVAEALSHAHENGIVHRDIKPSNLLLDSSGKVWVADFGLAKTEDNELTRTGDVLGTLRFLSPEQLEGICDRRSDIYSLGMTMYELLSLQPGFENTTQFDVIEKIRNQSPRKLTSINQDVPRDLVTIVEKAIEKEPARRYQTASAMAEDLRLFLSCRPIKARPASQWEHLKSWSRRNPGTSVSLSAVLLLLVVGLVGTTIAAWQFRTMAIEQKKLVEIAERETNANEQNLYDAEMKLALDIAQSPYGAATLTEILNRWVPENDTVTDRRGFEWFWLKSMASPNVKPLGDWPADHLSFTSDGRLVCFCSGSVVGVAAWPEFNQLWEMDPIPNGHYIIRAEVSPGGTLVAVRAASPNENAGGVLRIVDWRSNQTLYDSSEDEFAPVNFAWHPTDDRIAILYPSESETSSSGTIHVFSVKSKKIVHKIQVPWFVSEIEGELTYSCDGKWLAVNARDLSNGRFGVVCYNFELEQFDKTLFGKKCRTIVSLSWHRNSSQLAFLSHDGILFRWDVERDTSVTRETQPRVQKLLWDRTGEHLVLSGSEFVQWLDPTTLKKQRHWLLDGLETIVSVPGPDTDHMILVTKAGADASMNPPIGLSPLHYPHRRFQSPAIQHISHTDWVGRIEWHPAGDWFTTSLSAGTNVWDASSGEQVGDVPAGSAAGFAGEAIGWDIEGRLLSLYRDSFDVWDQTGSQRLRQIAKLPNRWSPICLSSTKREVFILYRSRENGKACWGLSILDLASGSFEKLTAALPCHAACGYGLSPDDKLFAIGVDHRLLVIDLAGKVDRL